MMRGSPLGGGGGGSIENGNRLGQRPVVRQSKFYREGNAGNAMKGLLGQDSLAWDTEKNEGVFAGQALYDGRSQAYNANQQQQQPFFGGQQQQQQFGGQQPQQQQRRSVHFGDPQVYGGSGGGAGGGIQQSYGQQPPIETAEYPFPGSVCSCDACGQVVNRYYHCANCREETGLFDLCVVCCGQMYLQGGKQIPHPTHDYAAHQMIHVVPRS